MINTWTFAPLQNKREYTENEKIVLEYFFTNIDKNVYCAKNPLSNQLWAFLVWQYSRSEASMRDRFLQLFDDSKNAFEKWLITNEEYISLDDLAKDITNSKSLNLDFFEQKASDFLKKWWVDFGHNSLKDADRIRFAVEWISQVFTKVIESPFPTLWDFQEKSTRYLHFWKESLILPADLLNSNFASDIKEITGELMDTYLKSFEIVKKALQDNQIVKREEFTSDRSYENTLNAKVFDIVRYLLPSNVCTSLWASFSTRTLESHLTYMLSHPLLEVRTVAESMHNEALKLSPWLLRHVWVSEYELKKRENMSKYTKELFNSILEKEDEIGFFKWISDEDRVSVVFEWELDDNICASLLFENARIRGLSYNDCLDIVNDMDKNEKEHLMKFALWDRWTHDRMPRALQHSSIMFEFLLDFGAYRDIQRHRASGQLWQWATAISGYDYPEYIDLPWMEWFMKMYDDVMTKATVLSNDIIKDNCYLSEYACAMGHLVRTTFEMNPGQLAYVIEQRTTPWGHDSYRRLFIEVYNQLKELAPIYSKFIRVWKVEDQSSRKIQEEKSESKRKQLGI